MNLNRIITTTTPSGNNWFYEYYVKEDELKDMTIEIEEYDE